MVKKMSLLGAVGLVLAKARRSHFVHNSRLLLDLTIASLKPACVREIKCFSGVTSLTIRHREFCSNALGLASGAEEECNGWSHIRQSGGNDGQQVHGDVSWKVANVNTVLVRWRRRIETAMEFCVDGWAGRGAP
jgi:hypothetical protein